MRKNFKVKIVGDSPSALILSLVLVKLDCEIYLYNISKNSNFISQYDIFSITNFTKKILIKFDIWNEFEHIFYGYNSLSITDNVNHNELLLDTYSIKEGKKTYDIGWNFRYSIFKNKIFDILSSHDNFNLISDVRETISSNKYDLNIIFNKSYRYISRLENIFNCLSKNYNKKSLIFNVYLRGNVDQRLYEFNTNKGFLVLTPISKNLYQINWNDNVTQTNQRLLLSKSFLLDNLTTLLPNKFMIDQVVGEIKTDLEIINYLPFKFFNNSIYIHEGNINSNLLKNLYFNLSIYNIVKINNIIKENNFKTAIINKKLKYNFYIREIFRLPFSFYIPRTLIMLLIGDNIFLSPIKKIFFIILNKNNKIINSIFRFINNPRISIK